MSAACRESWELLKRSPGLTKAIFASGLLISATVISPVANLVVQPLKAELWGQRMSQYGALVQALTNVVAIVCSGIFGRWSDSVDRRTAVVVVGVIAFMPYWSLLPLLLLDMPEVALYSNSVLSVISGTVCLTSTGCPTVYALVNDLMHPDDRELAFGLAFALNVVTILASNLAGLLVAALFKGGSLPLVIFNMLLNCGFFALVALIGQKPGGEQGGSSDDEQAAADSGSTTGSGDSDGQPPLSFLAPLKLACGHAPLRNTCIVIALVSIPETACLDVNNQYVLDLLGLLGATGASEKQSVQVVQSLLCYPGQFLLFPAFYAAGVAAQRVGALSLTRHLVVAVAVMQTLPVLLRWAPHLWAVVLEGICLLMTFTIFPPLQTVTAHVAPKDRVGEAMSATGASKQLAALCGNALVTVLSPLLLSSNIQSPLSLMFPLCGVLCLVAMPFAARIEIFEDDI